MLFVCSTATAFPFGTCRAFQGVSKEAVAMASGFLAKHGYAALKSDCPRMKVAHLTTNGLKAQVAHTNELR